MVQVRLSRLFAGWLVLVVLFAASAALAEEELRATPKAREHFTAGLAHIDDPAGPKYEEAYHEFKAAYAETPSYEIAVNVGYCAFFLERDAEALEMYLIYLAKATDKDIPPKKRVQMQKDIQSLRSGMVKVSLRVTPANAVIIDERSTSKGANIVNRYPIENGVAQLGIHPGYHKFTITAQGYQAQSWEFEAQPASSHAHDFTLIGASAGRTAAGSQKTGTAAVGSPNDSAPTEKSTQSVSPMAYVGAMATGVFTAGAVGMGLAANSKKSDFESANDGTQYSKAQDLRTTAKTLALVSDVCLGAAVLSAGTAAYFLLTSGSQSARDPQAATGARGGSQKAHFSLSPMVSRQQAIVELEGSF